MFTVKGNQSELKNHIQSIDDEDFSPPYAEVNKGHGRIETRTIRTSSVLNGYVDFPYVGQVAHIHRHVTNLNGDLVRGRQKKDEDVYLITSLSPEKASCKQLLEFNRDHWHIENRLHYVRDVTFNEDRSRIRKKNGPHVMATIKNLVISLFMSLGDVVDLLE